MNFPTARISRVFVFVSVLILSQLSLKPVIAADAYGNRFAQEYGDAVYKENIMLGYNYNHVGIFAGLNSSTDIGRVVQTGGVTTQEVSFLDNYISPSTPATYYGAYTLDNWTFTFYERKAIVTTGELLVAQAIIYPILAANALDYYGSNFDGSVTDISNIRCDGFVEYSYEANLLRVWRNTYYADVQWCIALYPDSHNTYNVFAYLTRNPDTELSPWAQRGAPPSTGPLDLLGAEYVGPPWPDTHMTQAAVINLPTYEVTQYQGIGYVDVTVKATDESGINRIYYKLPGSSTWTPGVQQPQHPTSDTSSETIRVTNEGVFYYLAMDNGGNFPGDAQGVSIHIPTPTFTPTVTSTGTITTSPTPTPTFTGRSVPVIYPNPSDGTKSIILTLPLGTIGEVKIKIFTNGFRKIAEYSIQDASLSGGFISLALRDKGGAELSNGLYYIAVETNRGRYIAKWLVLK